MTVSLKIKGSNEVREFEKVHALNILRLKNCAFELPEDSPFEFVNNDFKRKPSKGEDKKPAAKRSTSRSGKASK